MFDLQSYLSRLLSLLQQAFGSRLLYLGLQGSYLRGEANETSDIDVMAVIDRFNAVDLPLYRQALEQAGYFEKSCGFVCGAAELAAWNPLEICHLLHTTQDVYGALAPLVPSYTEQDQLNFIKLSLGNLLHLLTHDSLHADDSAAQADLPAAYQSAFFILQNLHFLRCGVFLSNKAQMLPALDGLDRQIVDAARRLKGGEAPNLSRDFPPLFQWCRQTLLDLPQAAQ